MNNTYIHEVWGTTATSHPPGGGVSLYLALSLLAMLLQRLRRETQQAKTRISGVQITRWSSSLSSLSPTDTPPPPPSRAGCHVGWGGGVGGGTHIRKN